jgi:uncharacterized damage-inducible protein DinB
LLFYRLLVTGPGYHGGMSSVPRWVERVFRFDVPIEMHPNLRARLAGTPARWEDLLRGLPVEVLTARDGAAWSVQEHLGHLADLDALHVRRLDELLEGALELSPADMSNALTEERAHNARPLREVLDELRAARGAFVARLDELPTADYARSALHPRLRQPMRLVDVLLFTAEHDDHHLARARELLRAQRKYGVGHLPPLPDRSPAGRTRGSHAQASD